MSLAIHLLRYLEQHLSPRAIDRFQLVHGQPILCVTMIERNRELLCIGIVPPIAKQFSDHRDGRTMRRSRDPFLAT